MLKVLRECQFNDCTPDAAVAILERMNRLEPDVGEPRTKQAIERLAPIEPVDEQLHFGTDCSTWNCLVVDGFAAVRTTHDLHWVGAAAVCAHEHVPDAEPARKESGLPRTQSLLREWLLPVVGCVRHYIQQTLDVARDARASMRESETTRDGRAHSGQIQDLPFDGRSGHSLPGPDISLDFGTFLEPHGGSNTKECAGFLTGKCQGLHQSGGIEGELRPARGLPNPKDGIHVRIAVDAITGSGAAWNE